MASSTVLNGPGFMYKLRPYFHHSVQIQLPTCMYKLNTFYESSGDCVEGASEVDNTEPALVELQQRQNAIFRRLEQLKLEVTELAQKTGQTAGRTAHVVSKTRSTCTSQGTPFLDRGLCDIVINADPTSPPLSVLVLKDLLAQQCKVLSVCHVHSSSPAVPDALRALCESNGVLLDRAQYQLVITLIWKKVNQGPVLMVKPHEQVPIHGEANIARYLARLLHPAYDDVEPAVATEMDSLLDLSSQLQRGNAKEKAAVLRTLNARMGKSDFLGGNNPGLADIVLWSTVHQTKASQGAPGNVTKWLKNCNHHPLFENAANWL